jgi:hypothetical protein
LWGEEKVDMMKKSIILIVAGVVILSVVTSGTIIEYLSNVVKTKTVVEGPPLELTIKDENDDWVKPFDTPLSLGSIYGTDNASWEYKITKLAHSEAGNAEIQLVGTLETKLFCEDGIGTKEIDTILVTVSCPEIELEKTYRYSNDDNADNDDFKPSDRGDYLEFELDTQIRYDQWGYLGTVFIVFNQYAMGEYTASMELL